MDKKSTKLGELLLENSLISEDQLVQALHFQKNDRRRLGEILLEKGWVEDNDLAQTLARMFQVPFVQLTDENIDDQAVNRISRELMETHDVLPIALDETTLTVATNNPLDHAALQEIENKTGLMINPVMVSRQNLEKYIRRASDSHHQIQAIKTKSYKNVSIGETAIGLVDSTIKRAISERASDIHIEPRADGVRVRFRIDGVLYEKIKFAKNLERNILSRIKVMAGMDVAESRRPQDGRMEVEHSMGLFELRISTLPNLIGENMVIRILSKKFVGQSFSSLGLEPSEIAVIEHMIQQPHGLILVTGPTGSGKTTTLYSMLSRLNDPTKNIISVEDPIEYELEGINQTSVRKQIGYTFATAMRNILRHDPDIIMIGEIRDVETAQMAIQAALTGHLVLSTIHTNTSSGAVTRLLEMGIEPFLISSSLMGVIAQRLVRVLCPVCARPQRIDEKTAELMSQSLGSKPQQLVQAVGCPGCLQSGYQGREGIFEILKINQNIRELILHSESEKTIEKAALNLGMKTLRIAGLEKVLSGKTTVEEVLRVTLESD